jgi:hypothetical protein
VRNLAFAIVPAAPDVRLGGLARGASGGCKRSSRSICRSPSISRISVAQDLAAEIEDGSERLPAYYGLWSVSFLRGDLATKQEMAAAFLDDAEKNHPRQRPSSLSELWYDALV